MAPELELAAPADELAAPADELAAPADDAEVVFAETCQAIMQGCWSE